MKKLALCSSIALATCAASHSALAQQHLQYYGYYANNSYISANQDHTNITFVGVWVSDISQASSSIMSELATAKKYGVKAIVEVSPFLFTSTSPNLGCPLGSLPTASQTWSAFVNQLISNGYLVPNNPGASTVVAFYPVDEPDGCGLGDINGVANPALVNAINTIRQNPNTSSFPVATIYSSNYLSAVRSIPLFDWVGMDNYSINDGAYISAFDNFENYTNKSKQKTILIPQAATGGPLDNTPDTPSTMFSAAESDPSVIMLMPFLWAHNGWTGTSQIPWLLEQYTYIGKQIKYGLFAHFVSQSVPSVMNAGQTYSVSIQLQNTGSDTWASPQAISLGSLNPRDNNTWTGTNRVALPKSIAPGQTATFTFNVKAPSQPGSYNFQWEMVDDGVSWFGDITPNVAITVVSPPSGWISASPNPCIIPYGGSLCTSTISWSTNHPQTQVWVTDADGSHPQLFYGGAASASASAGWITAAPHIFYLESNGAKFGSVSVSGRVTTTPPSPPSPPPCPLATTKQASVIGTASPYMRKCPTE